MRQPLRLHGIGFFTHLFTDRFKLLNQLRSAGKGGIGFFCQRFTSVHNTGLRQVGNTGVLFHRNGTGIGLHYPCDNLHQGGFTAAVGSGKRRLCSLCQYQRNILQNIAITERKGDI